MFLSLSEYCIHTIYETLVVCVLSCQRQIDVRVVKSIHRHLGGCCDVTKVHAGKADLSAKRIPFHQDWRACNIFSAIFSVSLATLTFFVVSFVLKDSL